MIAILGLIYWSTLSVIDRQITATIEAEIRGLADQYRDRGLGGLVDVMRDRSLDGDQTASVYLLTTPNLLPLVGNLERWPASAEGVSEWLRLHLDRVQADRPVGRDVLVRTFTLPGGYRLLVGRDMDERGRFRQIIVRTLFWSLAATLAISLLGGIFVSRRLLARVEGLTRATRDIVRGDLSRRIVCRGTGDEFDRLTASLNRMFAQIERLMSGMRLATDSIAHDLRGPLTRLRGRIELALLQPSSAVHDREALLDILQQADVAITMFDNLLKIATAEAGVAATELRPLDLSVLARDAADLYEPVAEDKHITLTCQVSPTPTIFGQRELLAQAVANLLDNAVKHTPSGGAILVDVAKSGNDVMLTVADNGPGIAEKDRARVLDRFVRLEECRTTPGAGLGLSLVAAVAQLHGATLNLSDNGPGLPGLKVTMRFPTRAGDSEGTPSAAVAATNRPSKQKESGYSRRLGRAA